MSKEVRITIRLDDVDQAAIEALALKGEAVSDTVRRVLREAAALWKPVKGETKVQALARAMTQAQLMIDNLNQLRKRDDLRVRMKGRVLAPFA